MNTKNIPLVMLLVRSAAAGNMLIHGITRLSLGTVSNFDGYLNSIGFPPYTAWALTIFELVGAIAIIAGKWVTPLALVFCLELSIGIILVHFNEGWFVVGAGRNGMEYSVLLIVCFVSAAIAYRKKENY
jgi:putative oxidoreductase